MGLLDSIKGLFTSASVKIEQTAEMAKNVVENSSGSLNEIKDAVSNAATELAESGKEFIDKSAETLSHTKNVVLEKGNEIIEAAKETIHHTDSKADKEG